MKETGIVLIISLFLLLGACKSDTDDLVIISTKFGNMTILLYDETPKHKENFLKLASDGFYDSLIFHRVIQGFMVQGGNHRLRKDGKFAGHREYLIDPEFDSAFFHKKGVIAAARTENPAKASSFSQFYLVQGRTFTDQELDMLEIQTAREIPEYQRNVYKNLGGTPHLDQEYTVFGEVVQGIEVIDKIADQPTGPDYRPNSDITMAVKVETLNRKEITKKYGFKYPEIKK
jgi:cyclophilin family peptidyl-prolyl cis-trans isomerase